MIPFSYFNQMHIALLLLCFFIGHLVLVLPKYYWTDKRKAARFMELGIKSLKVLLKTDLWVV